MADLKINYTSSVDGFVWQRQPLEKIERGMFVFLCPDNLFPGYVLLQNRVEAGYCGGYSPLLKKIVALSGDKVRISSSGVFVNGSFIQNSKPQPSTDLPVLNFSGVLPVNTLVVMGQTPNSLDSRYFGVIDESYITGEARKIF